MTEITKPTNVEIIKFDWAARKNQDSYFVRIGNKWRLFSEKEILQLDKIDPLANYLDYHTISASLYNGCHNNNKSISEFLTEERYSAEHAHRAALEKIAERDPDEILA